MPKTRVFVNESDGIRAFATERFLRGVSVHFTDNSVMYCKNMEDAENYLIKNGYREVKNND